MLLWKLLWIVLVVLHTGVAHFCRSNSTIEMFLYSSRNSCTGVWLLVRLEERRECARKKRVPSGADARIIYSRTARQKQTDWLIVCCGSSRFMCRGIRWDKSLLLMLKHCFGVNYACIDWNLKTKSAVCLRNEDCNLRIDDE